MSAGELQGGKSGQATGVSNVGTQRRPHHEPWRGALTVLTDVLDLLTLLTLLTVRFGLFD